MPGLTSPFNRLLGIFALLLATGLGTAGIAFGAEAGHGGHHLPGKELDLIWVLPFAGILLSIAFMPLFLPRIWHHHFGKISAFWALCFLVPCLLVYGFQTTSFLAWETFMHEYLPFIILLFALFTVSGGVRIKGSLVGTPVLNTGILAIGTVLASFMGTTGAAMLLIRPLCRANDHRKHRVHTVVFFIFLVANIGGSLSPLGDPPLFLGFLKGVSFFWPTTAMFLPMLILSILLLVIYFVLDTFLHRREDETVPMNNIETGKEGEKFGLEGSVNLLLLAGVVGFVLYSGFADDLPAPFGTTAHFLIYDVDIKLANLIRDFGLVGLAGLSLLLTVNESRRLNGFTWFPIIEVATLFAGIFMTIIPALSILRAGSEGALGWVIDGVTQADGTPFNAAYFWATGVLSSFLDNAPTYLVFFNTAGGDPEQLMGELSGTLLAISAGAVFMGAVTYIGNAPNFMVRSIAEDRGIKMPSFFGYMAWSVGILMPLFVLITFLFFNPLTSG
ncbi:MAG: sodium:proton antiporter [Alphaproteobacteria bacterium TMED89]|nr:sodium:proton antiporter [Rhodospirillaceae bacterium]RPH13914.1 MAG: sodium:proton antiporter [Alphaproteobacteria bacterium TMED89]